MVQSVLSNFAIIFVVHIIIEKLEAARTNDNERSINALVITVISASIISMYYLPITFGEYGFDLRLIPLLFAAFTRPKKMTFTILGIAVVFRWLMGGEGAVPGTIFGLILPTLFVMLFTIKEFSKRKLLPVIFISTAVWMISDIPAIVIIPNGWEVFKQLATVHYSAFLLATIVMYFVISTAKNRLELQKRLHYESRHDSLTGVLNKKGLLEVVKHRTKERKLSFIAMVDVDHFKQVNDRFGHFTGDKLLKEIADLLSKPTPDAYGVVGRYGGEEFIYYLEADSINAAVVFFDELRERVKHHHFYSHDGKRIEGVTVSIGISPIDDSNTIALDLEKADKCVYKAKKLGRNCIVYK